LGPAEAGGLTVLTVGGVVGVDVVVGLILTGVVGLITGLTTGAGDTAGLDVVVGVITWGV